MKSKSSVVVKQDQLLERSLTYQPFAGVHFSIVEAALVTKKDSSQNYFSKGMKGEAFLLDRTPQ